jgi:hypothetical protein
MVELLGLEEGDLVGCHGRNFKASTERTHGCFQTCLLNQRWFVTIKDDENDESDGLVPTQKLHSARTRQLHVLLSTKSRKHLL